MEYIKKTIQQAVTTGATTGCTNCAIIVPDLTVSYYIKFCLTSDDHDFGFFDVYPTFSYYSGYGYGDEEPIGLNNLLT